MAKKHILLSRKSARFAPFYFQNTASCINLKFTTLRLGLPVRCKMQPGPLAARLSGAGMLPGIATAIVVGIGTTLWWLVAVVGPDHGLYSRTAGQEGAAWFILIPTVILAVLVHNMAESFRLSAANPARRVYGVVGSVLAAVLLFIAVLVASQALAIRFGFVRWWNGWGFYAALAATLLLWWWLWGPAREFIGWLSTPFIRLARALDIGKGGSAGFGGLLQEWCCRFKPGAILLGSSLYDPSWKVGIKDDRGLLTIASSRSGKGRSAIIPNLIIWPGSALVIDPKGTNAAVTAARRGRGGGRVSAYLGQDVHVVDPFGIVKGVRSSAFNPLSSIDINGPRVTEDIGLVADALVVPGEQADTHWDEAARTILCGVIAHLLATGKGASLVDVRNALHQQGEQLDEMLSDMLSDMSAGGLPATAASLITNAGGNERGSFFTTIIRNIRWLDSPAMQGVLGRSDFEIGNLKSKPMTVYVVLPPELLDEHKRFMRLFVNLAIRGLSQGGRGRYPVLFLLDEFYSLGKLTLLEKAAGLLAGYNLRLWPIVQNLTQLQQLYPKNWETFFANAGAVQVFSVNDNATAEYLAGRLGKRVSLEMAGNHYVRVVNDLRQVEELGRDVSRESMRQVIFRSGDDPLILRRLQYDTAFPKHWFNPDPDHEEGGEDVKSLGDVVAPKALPPAAPPLPKLPAAVHQKLLQKPKSIGSFGAFGELDQLIGLTDVKRETRNVIDQIMVNREREKLGLKVPDMSFHLVFTGNPGTGKTTVARIVGQIYAAGGVLKKGHMIEVDRGDLIGKHIGQTAPKTAEVVNKALDGILFIDEAYSLVSTETHAWDFGHEAVATLLKMMEDNRGRLVVIAAGYREEMHSFIDSNPGLKSRFKTFIDFPDYSAEEMCEIFALICEQNKMTLTEDAEDKVIDVIAEMAANRGKGFGNGREIRNLFEKCWTLQASRLRREGRMDHDSLTTFTADDIPGSDSGGKQRETRRTPATVPAATPRAKDEALGQSSPPSQSLLNYMRVHKMIPIDSRPKEKGD